MRGRADGAEAEDAGEIALGADVEAGARSRRDALPVGTRLGDSYELQESIGRGANGTVYRAMHRQLRRPCAVKVVDAHGDTNGALRLVREARAASAIRHENIVEVTDLGHTQEGFVYVAMELLEGLDLERRMAEGPLPDAEVRRIVSQILDALSAAHDAGIVHRDLKPANVFLSDRDGPSAVKLLDFGLSKRSTEDSLRLTRSGQLMGTPLYMAPEQSRGQEVGSAADLYSLAVLGYELLAGAVPFPATSIYECVLSHATVEPPPLSARRPELPSPVCAVLHRALEKQPRDRYESAAEMRRAWETAWDAPRGAPVRERGWAPGLVALAVVTCAVGLALAFVSGARDEAPVTRASTPPSRSPRIQPPAPQPTPHADEPARAGPGAGPAVPEVGAGSTHAVQIVSVPTGAEVFAGQTSLGSTPLDLPFPPGIDRRSVVLRLEGSRPSRVDVDASGPSVVRVQLREITPTGDEPPALAPL